LKNRIFLFSFLKNLFIYLRERKRAGVRESVHEQEGGAKGGEEGQEDSDSPLSREQTWGSIPGSRDHDPSPRQTPNQMSHPDTPKKDIFQIVSEFSTVFFLFVCLFVFWH